MSAKQLKGTNVFSKIVPGTENDTYPTHDSLYGHGGYKEVATIAERDAIPIERLKDGTVVYVSANKTEYRYQGDKWVIKPSGGGGGGASTLGELSNVSEEVDDTELDSNTLMAYDKDTGQWVPRFQIFIPTGTAEDGSVIKTFEDLMAYIDTHGGGGGPGGLQRNVRLTNELPSRNVTANRGEPCNLIFTFTSEERYSDSEPWEPTGERGLLTVSIRRTEGGSYEQVDQRYISSGIKTTIDVASWLTTGANSVMLSCKGEVTGESTASLVYTVTLTSLNVTANNFQWWTAYTGPILVPFNISGNISKILVVTLTGDNGYEKTYEENIGTTTYIEIPYNLIMEHPGISGVYTMSAYVKSSDGTLVTRTIFFKILCPVAGEAVKLIAINNIAEKITNYVENDLYDYSIYDGDNISTHLDFTITKDGKPVYKSEESRILTSTKYTLKIPLDIETPDNQNFNVLAHISQDNVEIGDPIQFLVDNSLGFSAMPGSNLYFNPRTRNNNQANRLQFINEVTGKYVNAVWKNMNWGNDGYQIDSQGNSVLRLFAGSLVTVDYQPFLIESARTGKTLEIDFKISNVTDFEHPIITIATDVGDTFIGLKIFPDKMQMYSQSLKNVDDQTLYFWEDDRIRLTLTIMPAAYGRHDFNLCILYINGIKNREFAYERNDYFAQGGKLIIGSDYGDVDIYGVREYLSPLTTQGVLNNFVNWVPTVEEKNQVKRDNDILDVNGSEVDFQNTVDQYNVIVFDQPIPSLKDQTARTGTLWVYFHDNPEWNVYITTIGAKGQGTSSMRYWIWNTRYTVNKSKTVIHKADGTEVVGMWEMVPYIIPGSKFTAKKNYASSMQSHKMGSCNAFNDVYREMGLRNEAMETEKYAKARVATYQLPFIGFEKQINEDGEEIYVFRGLYTMGPDKGDKFTYGHDTDIFPNVISTEGADNSPLCTLFRIPWNKASGRFIKDEKAEAYLYNGQKSWNIGEGNFSDENWQKFIDAYNQVYSCSPRLVPFDGTLDDLNSNIQEYRNNPNEYWIAKSGDPNEYNVYYFEVAEQKFIPSDFGEGQINLYTQLVDKGYGLTASQLTGQPITQKNELFIKARVQKFRLEASNHWEIEDCMYFANNVEFYAGTDERAKNTYPYNFGTPTSKWRWRADDTDTRFDITNRGLPDKSYSVEVHDLDSTGAAIWNGETNNFFNLLELSFPDEKVANMRRQFDAMEALSGKTTGNDLDKLFAFYDKYFPGLAQKYFPINAYNADAKYCYEEGKIAYMDGEYTNDTDPITQSLGDHYSAEKRWIYKRIIYMMSKYSYGMFSAKGSDTIVVRAAGNVIKYQITPAMDLYPAIANGTTIIRGKRTKAGEVCEIEVELSGSGDQQNAIQGASFLQDIGDWHDKNVQGSMIISGRMLREIRLGSKTEPIVISISSLTISNCVSLQKLILSNIKTLTGNLNIAACTHIKEVYAGGTSLVQIVLPNGGGLEVIEYSQYNQYLTLQNYPLLTYEGVRISECITVLTDFFITDCTKLKPMLIISDIMDAQASQGTDHNLKRIRAVGFDEHYSDGEILDKLAALVDGTYEGLNSSGVAGDDPYPVLDGKITVDANAYEDSIRILRERFPKMELIINGEYFIRFTDPVVLAEVLRRWDVNGDGGIVQSEADLVTQIPASMFANNTQIVSTKGFETFRNCNLIGVSAFQNSSLKEMYFPICNNGPFYEIGVRSFNNCKVKKIDLTAINIPLYIRSGGGDNYFPFWNCTELEEFIMNDFDVPSSVVQMVMNRGFSDCTKLKVFRCKKWKYTSVSNPNQDWPLPGFSNCTSLEECTFEEISGFTNNMPSEFFNNTPIRYSRIPASIWYSSYGYQYSNTPNLEVVAIEAANYSNMNQAMFRNAAKKPVLLMLNMTVPCTVSYAGIDNLSAIYVPDEAVQTFKSASGWSAKASIIYPLSSYTGYIPTKLYEI